MVEDVILAIETSQRQGSVALARGAELCAARTLSADRRNAAELMPAIAELLDGAARRLADVTVFAYSCGPGSFTGLRVAATIGRMLQSAVGCAVVAAPTLEVIAENARSHPAQPARMAVMLDARGGRVFGGLFERRGDELLTVRPAELFEPQLWLRELPRPVWVLGAGVGQHADVIAAAGVEVLDEAYWPARAEHVVAVGRRLADAGRFCEPGEIVPHYVRRPECEEVYEQRRTEARRRRGE